MVETSLDLDFPGHGLVLGSKSYIHVQSLDGTPFYAWSWIDFILLYLLFLYLNFINFLILFLYLHDFTFLPQAFSNDQTVSLQFQPGNPYCKPSQGVATRTSSLLMKVKRRYRRSKAEDAGTSSDGCHGTEAASPKSEYSAEILGLVGQKYEFPSKSGVHRTVENKFMHFMRIQGWYSERSFIFLFF